MGQQPIIINTISLIFEAGGWNRSLPVATLLLKLLWAVKISAMFEELTPLWIVRQT